MTLKIVGRSPRATEHRQPPNLAKGVTLQCDACHGSFGVVFPYINTVETRQREIKKAADEHRKVCTAGDAEQGREYKIWYPRA